MQITDITKFDAYQVSLLIKKIENVKPDFDDALDEVYDTIKGFRYGQNGRIARLILGQLFTECDFDCIKANAKFISLNSTEIIPYIKDAVIESARADYHYAYEKKY